MKKIDCAAIFFESPQRILKTLITILEHYGNYDITFVRELTKKNEEVINSKIEHVIEILSQREKILGEITIIIKASQTQNKDNISDKEILAISNKLTEDGLNISEISRIISNDFNIPKRDIYQLLIKK